MCQIRKNVKSGSTKSKFHCVSSSCMMIAVIFQPSCPQSNNSDYSIFHKTMQVDNINTVEPTFNAASFHVFLHATFNLNTPNVIYSSKVSISSVFKTILSWRIADGNSTILTSTVYKIFQLTRMQTYINTLLPKYWSLISLLLCKSDIMGSLYCTVLSPHTSMSLP